MTIRTVFSVAALASCLLFTQSIAGEVTRLSEPVSVTDDAEVFGAPLNEDARQATLYELMEEPQEFLDTPIRVESRITQVCRKKGCFMIATSGPHAIRVSFKDYGFFVPTDTGGKTVTFTGTLIERELTEEQAAHFRQDAGGSDTIQAGKVYEIVADAVSIPKS